MSKLIKVSIGKQKGFSLIEALVAFLILSVGMLGIGSLQLISLKAGNTAAFRTVAVIKVEEMFERIRNNPTQIIQYEAAVAVNNNCNDYGTFVPCTPFDMVAYDIYEWQQSLTEVSNDNASLTRNADIATSITVADPIASGWPLAVVTIQVTWEESNAVPPVTMSYSASADICVTTAC